MERLIFKYTQGLPGPLLICLAGIHGNEIAGISALQRLEEMLVQETASKPHFVFTGTVIGLVGNVEASESQTRFIESDLNRMFLDESVTRILEANFSDLEAEELELRELLTTIDEFIKETLPTKVVILDLHTTSARGGLFAIPSDQEESIRIAKALHAPVIKGFMSGLKGTTLHYFSNNGYKYDQPVIPLVFEAGQHTNPLSVNRMIAAVVNCLRTIGCVDHDDVVSQHDEILKAYSEHLPALTRLIHRHQIIRADEFVMEPGFENFQKIKKGELLARDKNGNIYSDYNGYILMPLYQRKGEDGFFIIQDDK